MRIFSAVIFILLFSGMSLTAQNFKVVVEDTIALGLPGEEIVLGGHIVNLTADSLDIQITREANELPENWFSALCIELCAAPFVDTIAGKIPPDKSLEFSIHFFTSSEPGEGRALLVVKEPHGAESESYLFRAITSAVDISWKDDSDRYSLRLIGNYPNPFNNSMVISFQAGECLQVINLQVFSIIGQLVFEETIPDLPMGESQISFRARDLHNNVLSNGTYIYRLSLTTISGKKSADIGRFTLLK